MKRRCVSCEFAELLLTILICTVLAAFCLGRYKTQTKQAAPAAVTCPKEQPR